MPSDDDFCSPKPPIPFPAAPRRPEKKGDVQSLPIVSVAGSTLYSDLRGVKNEIGSENQSGDTCAVCSKNLSHLNDIRKVAHVNKCLDAQESSSNHEKAKEKWSSTIDCPMCGEPQPPGPHRSAHAKRCGKTYNIAPKELLKLMDTQRRVSDIKKRNAMIHTKAPVPQKKEVQPPKLEGAPNSLLDENLQLAKAISASMDTQSVDPAHDTSPQFTRIIETDDRRRKRPRSYAVVELAPRSCRCEVVEKIQNRFLETFRVRKTNGATLSHAELSKRRAACTSLFMQNQARLLQKLERLERLSQDLNCLVGQEETSDIRIQCSDGKVGAHRLLLRLRTRLLGTSLSENISMNVQLDEKQKIVMMWLRYVYSGRVEWDMEDTENILRLAQLYGPDDLPSLCIRMRAPSKEEEMTSTRDRLPEWSLGSGSAKSERSIACGTIASSAPQSTSESNSNQPPAVKSEIIVPEELKVNLRETSAAVDVSEITLDFEDPLQGITLDQSRAEHSLEDECVIIDEAQSRLENCDQAACQNVEEISQIQSSELSERRANESANDCSSPAEDVVMSSSSNETGNSSDLTSIPNELESSQATTSSNSPDIFDEKSREGVKEASVASSDVTPLRSGSLRRKSSAARFPVNDEIINLSSKEHSTSKRDPAVENCDKPMENSPMRTNTAQNITTASDGSDNDIVCLGEQPATQASTLSNDPYRNEYFDYHDPFMEPWYDPVEIPAPSSSSQSPSEPVKEDPVKDDTETKSLSRSSRRRSSRIGRQSLTQIPTRLCSSSLEQAEATEDKNTPKSVPAHAASQDSFFDTPVFLSKEAGIVENDAGAGDPANFAQPFSQQTTPVQPAKKKARFGSNVKILKTSGITPMPNYDGMTDVELKRELARFGLKPMGRKRAVAMLKKIYTEVHPEIDPFTPTIRPLVVEKTGDGTPVSSRLAKPKAPRKRGNLVKASKETTATVAEKPSTSNVQVTNVDDIDDDDFIDLGDKTLNEPRDEPLEESMIDDTGILPKDLEGMTDVFLKWLRQPDNDDLYNHLLSLQPVLIDELHQRMSRANTAVCVIPKKALANILDRLGVTFSMGFTFGRQKARK